MTKDIVSLLPPEVVEQDRALEEQASTAGLALVQLRYRWSRDESNPDRVSFSQYARQTGRSLTAISRDANAYLILNSAVEGTMTVYEARVRASMSAERELAAEAVAKNRKISVTTAARDYPQEVKRVRKSAADAVREMHDRGMETTIEAEIPQVAEIMYHGQQIYQERKERRQQNHTFGYLKVESHVFKARNELRAALADSEGVPFEGYERQLIHETIETVQRLLHILDRAITDENDKSWREELRVIEGGLA